MINAVWIEAFIDECIEENLSHVNILKEAERFAESEMIGRDSSKFKEDVREYLVDYYEICPNCGQELFFNEKEEINFCPVC